MDLDSVDSWNNVVSLGKAAGAAHKPVHADQSMTFLTPWSTCQWTVSGVHVYQVAKLILPNYR